jgi:hypothetical protein
VPHKTPDSKFISIDTVPESEAEGDVIEAPETAKQHLWAELMVRDSQAGRGTTNERDWTRMGSFHCGGS